jgi:hypothetical protein
VPKFEVSLLAAPVTNIDAGPSRVVKLGQGTGENDDFWGLIPSPCDILIILIQYLFLPLSTEEFREVLCYKEILLEATIYRALPK